MVAFIGRSLTLQSTCVPCDPALISVITLNSPYLDLHLIITCKLHVLILFRCVINPSLWCTLRNTC